MNVNIRDAWPFISNTDKINRSFTVVPIEFRTEKNSIGGSTIFGKSTDFGIVSEFKEYPFEWIENKTWSVHREFLYGILKYLYFEIKIETTEKGFIANHLVRAVPKNILLKPIIKYELKKNTIRGIINSYKTIEDYLRFHTGIAIPSYGFKPLSTDPEKYNSLKSKLEKISDQSSLSEKLSRFLLDTPDNDLLKIKPVKVSKILEEDKKKVLEVFLRGTKAGLFDMSWDILCPECRGSASSIRKLDELPDAVHCSSCNIDYGPDFDRNVEITFTTNPSIREVIGSTYCMGGPGNTPHIVVQQRVKKFSEKILELDLKEGNYRIYSPQKKNSIRLIVCDRGIDEDFIEFSDNNLILEIKPAPVKFILINEFDYEIVVKFEDASYLTDIVTASEVTALQEFRFHFSNEVLRKGQEISVKSIAILFTDLKGSTSFYNIKGDAFAYKIVSDHFDILFFNVDYFNGAIVKTIGDAIMAVFINPLDAIKYSLKVQAEINKYNENANDDLLKLKIGIHYGPALVVNLNDRLDYFGTTVNLAARTEGQCQGNDIVITKKIYDIPAVKEFLKDNKIEKFEASVKGFNESYSLVRISL